MAPAEATAGYHAGPLVRGTAAGMSVSCGLALADARFAVGMQEQQVVAAPQEDRGERFIAGRVPAVQARQLAHAPVLAFDQMFDMPSAAGEVVVMAPSAMGCRLRPR